MSNFTFIKADFPELYIDVIEAEQLVFISSKASAVLSRSVLENAVNWLYENERTLERPWRADLNTLMHGDEFRALFNRTMFAELNLIRKMGNAAAHASSSGNRLSHDDALTSLKYLFRFLRFLAIYYGKTTPETQVFDEALIPRPESAQQKTSKAQQQAELATLLADIEVKNKANRDAEKTITDQAQENEQLREQLKQQQAELAKRKVEREKTVDVDTSIPLLVSEAETRLRYIDLSLKEAGWTNLREGYELEFHVVGMPLSTNPKGNGYVDYVLWGDDGLPLAVVEAKKTMANPKKGKHQAELYADCLEKMKGQRPIIFYTNGFETYLWDDQFSPEREVQGFFTKDELTRLIARRDPADGRQDLRQFKVNQAIAGKGRPYQLEAIARVAENSVKTVIQQDANGERIETLRSGSRQSLLVMATGSGKTRVSAAISDMMTKCNWAKRILFLADRNALVTQAKNNFNEYLPHLSAIDLTKEKEDDGTRIVFSTYPTIMNRIDGLGNSDERFYGVGHFDLIIIDEAHRSVYQKYKAIFSYFDAMLIGLTATPKSEVGHDTYGLFGIEDDNPTFAYELDKAVAQGFLVPPKAISVPLKFVREGIRYNDLSSEEQKQYEEKFGDPTQEEAPDEISSSAINTWLFNTHTVDQVLDHLMTNGIKVEGGDKVGKTIIFAKSHPHAIFIEERFNKNYPEYAGKFLRVIDNYESKAQDLLDVFVDEYEENDPQIAVSVDMMDTGVDAPRVVNLIFFKPVKSSTKFWQMIGRGTRLCEGLFGLNEDGSSNDKKEFVIFDYCENFEFFDANPDGATGNVARSLTQQIFEAKLEVALIIRECADSTDKQRELAEAYITELNLVVASLDTKRFVVKAKLRAVTEFSNKKRWESLSKNDMLDINTNISELILPVKDDDEFARRFDILILNFQLALLTAAHSTDGYINKISGIARDLLKNQNIPAIGLQVELLNELQTTDFWKVINVNALDNVRVSVRDLLKYLNRESQAQVITTFVDDLNVDGTTQHDLIPAYTALKSYKDRVESYVREHNDHLVIRKLKTNKSITETELNELEKILFDGRRIGTKQDYVDTYGEKPLGEFIRSIVGLEVSAVQSVFADFIQAGNLKANQMTFINNIISYLTKNGTIEKKMLFEPPFTNIHDQGLFGVFDDDAQAMNVIRLIDGVNDNAVVSGF
ncbi:restriction endonuclease subunit R [Psychromonas marina]|uniref:Restriction endonuclease subunit R n=1 Tax=Psychromonas marina TaxID=88364 RepID=A0ABQ6DVF9_9GAMM|nr:DEAD/DEAH box helicase family protein [Psychromonas marina]GLS89096.1 restriction endonuclease subunit R [Psychromonas marina]